jgi:hypothetical protein
MSKISAASAAEVRILQLPHRGFSRAVAVHKIDSIRALYPRDVFGIFSAHATR